MGRKLAVVFVAAVAVSTVWCTTPVAAAETGGDRHNRSTSYTRGDIAVVEHGWNRSLIR